MAKDDVELAPVRVHEDLRSTTAEVVALGFRVSKHWSGVDAVSERDAYAITCRRRVEAEQYDAAQRASQAAQEAWHRDRATVYRAAAAAALGSYDTPRARAEAKVAGVKAMLAWEKAHPPEDVGLPAGLRTDPELAEFVVPDPGPVVDGGGVTGDVWRRDDGDRRRGVELGPVPR